MNRPAFPGRPARRALLLAAACLLVNAASLSPGFIHDDQRIIGQNELIRDGVKVGEIFSKGYWSVGKESVPNLYRPVTILSFALNHALGGDRPLGYRLVNLALHLLVTILVYALGRRLFARSDQGRPAGVADRPAFLGALLFAVHPVHTEALGMIVGRAELLAAAGTLGCVLAFLHGRDRGAGLGLYTLSIVCLVVGFLAKENALVAPFLALLADLLLRGRRASWRYHAAALATLALLVALRASAIGSLGAAGFIHEVDNPIAHAPFVQGRLTALKVVFKYAVLLIAPLRLSIDYSFDAIPLASGILDLQVLLGGTILLAWAAGVVYLRRRDPGAAFALAWIGVSLAPTSNLLVPIGTIMAERLLYLPSVGFCLLVAGWVDRLPLWGSATAGSPARGRVGLTRLAIAIVVSAFAVRSVVRLRDWRDNYSVFGAALAVSPHSVRALYNYGTACEDRGEDAKAVEAYRKAVALWPAFAEAHYNLAGVLARRKEWDEAVRHYREALQRQPGEVQYLVNLGHALTGQGNPREAVEVLRHAVEIERTSDRAYTTLGAAYLALRDPSSAVAAYAEAVRIDPSSADYRRNLGLAQQEAGDITGASASFRRGLALRPDDPDLLAALGMAQLQGSDAAGAVASLERAVAARPAQPMFRYQLARALEQAGRRAEAGAAYREAIRLAPAAPIPHRGLGMLLYRLGERTEALQALERAAALDPGGTVMDEESRRALAALRGGPAR